MELGLHRMSIKSDFWRASRMDFNQSFPAEMLSPSDETNTSNIRKKSRVNAAFSFAATSASSLIWLMKACFVIFWKQGQPLANRTLRNNRLDSLRRDTSAIYVL